MSKESLYDQVTKNKSEEDERVRKTIILTKAHNDMLAEANINASKVARIGIEQAYASFKRGRQTEPA